jgi:hypothetical protein
VIRRSNDATIRSLDAYYADAPGLPADDEANPLGGPSV